MFVVFKSNFSNHFNVNTNVSIYTNKNLFEELFTNNKRMPFGYSYPIAFFFSQEITKSII